MSPLEATTLGRIAARGDLSASLTAIVVDDTVNMVEWWAKRNVATPIDGDDLARVRARRRELLEQQILADLNRREAFSC